MIHKLSWLSTGLLLIACLYLFFALFESYPEVIDSGWSADAKRNPYLAAQQFLQRQGIASESLNSLPPGEQLANIKTLYIEDSRDVLSIQQVSTLINWVAGGGALLVAAPHADDDASDPLLAELDISVRRSDCECQKYITPINQSGHAETSTTQEQHWTGSENAGHQIAEQNTEKNKAKRPLSQWLQQYNDNVTKTGRQDNTPPKQINPASLTSLHFDGVEETLEVYFPPQLVLGHPFLDLEDGESYAGIKPLYWTGSEWGVHFMQFQIGDGLITVISDANIWRSDTIAELDSAYLLSVLTKGNMRFLVGHQMPSIFTLLWQQAKEILIAFAAWLMLWLCYRSRRFLPPVDLTTRIRRSVSEHIEAVAYFLWQRRATDQLLNSLRDEIQQRAHFVFHDYHNANAAQRLNTIASHSQLPEQIVARALSTKTIRSEDQFTEVIQSLQKIRSTL